LHNCPAGIFPIRFRQGIGGNFGVYNNETAFIRDLIGEVSSISLKNRANALLQYEIHKSKKGVCP
jgi:hypothetical protein